ncbi:MAG: crossover junction endodeoxyribonuclease RuvC [Acidimicrobiales bacterium]|nr:MAG: crossover junction endodeoxyribonuclease RuvC [Acidimicrobiales bacterium]
MSTTRDVSTGTFVHVFVVGFDPGLTRCGYAVLELGGRGGKEICRALGTIRTDLDEDTPGRLAALQHECAALLDEWTPCAAAVERIFFKANARTAMSVAQASGVVLAELGRRGIPVSMYTPSEVKSAVAGDGAALKGDIRRMVRALLRLTHEIVSPDAADAAAVALCHVAKSSFRDRAGVAP